MDDLQKLMLSHLPRLRRFALGLTGNMSDADDLVQSTVERALCRFGSFEPGTKMDSWMFKIAQNLWIDQRRALSRKGQSVDLDDALDLSGEDGRVTIEHRAMINDIRTAIANLPEAQQLVVAHVLIDGQSYKEAAHNLGIPIGTLMSRLSRARKALEAHVFGGGMIQ